MLLKLKYFFNYCDLTEQNNLLFQSQLHTHKNLFSRKSELQVQEWHIYIDFLFIKNVITNVMAHKLRTTFYFYKKKTHTIIISQICFVF